MAMASSSQINEASRMASAVDLFTCGLCQFIVTPYPLECPACNRLFSENCVKSQRNWSCPHANCRSRMRPVKMHNNVREILELMQFNCPGCGERKRYNAFFEHVKTCTSISSDSMVSTEQMQKIVSQNQNAPAVHHNYSRLSRYIYILEKDTKNLLQYDR